MAISTNSVIHYTGSFVKLKSILKEGFKIKYCEEKLKLGGHLRGTLNGSNTAHPMVCFCDIPLSHSKKHSDSYGKYGIGLTKEWAFKNKLNPVLYIDRNSFIADMIHGLIKSEMQLQQVYRIKACAKNYSGEVGVKGKYNPEYRFYDEREWRFLPCEDDLEFKKCRSAFSLSSDQYIKNKDKYNNQISSYRLKFEANDISYLIVKSITQIPALIDFLRKNYKCTGEQLDILLSKVCTIEQIETDF